MEERIFQKFHIIRNLIFLFIYRRICPSIHYFSILFSEIKIFFQKSYYREKEFSLSSFFRDAYNSCSWEWKTKSKTTHRASCSKNFSYKRGFNIFCFWSGYDRETRGKIHSKNCSKSKRSFIYTSSYWNWMHSPSFYYSWMGINYSIKVLFFLYL